MSFAFLKLLLKKYDKLLAFVLFSPLGKRKPFNTASNLSLTTNFKIKHYLGKSLRYHTEGLCVHWDFNTI